MKINNTKIFHETIQSAIGHIKKVQQPCGNFLSLSSASPGDFSNAAVRSTTFFTSNILSCLCSVASLAPDALFPPKVRDDLTAIIRRGTDFLLKEKSGPCSFNYFTQKERERGIFLYPDDLDDTFAALVALQRYQPDVISGNTLAAATTLLIDLEVNEGGPYRTWIMPSNTQRIANDPDMVVNSTIGYFLSLLGVGSPRIGEYLTDAIHHKKFSSPYYPGECHVAYFLSRYLGAECLPLPSFRTSTPLELAMLISSQFNCNRSEDTVLLMADRVVDMVSKYGWRPYPFCIDPAQNHKTFYAGSSALTASFTAEALMHCLCLLPPESTLSVVHHTSTNVSFHRSIQDAANQVCVSLPESLATTAIAMIENASNAVITAPSYDLQKILQRKGFPISEGFMHTIALANLYGWIAYDTYDDFLDGQGRPPLLPLANYFLRKLVRTYSALAAQFPAYPITPLFDSLLNKVEAANAWEIAHCRIPAINGSFRLPERLPLFGTYENLADRSIGYAAGPLTELLLAGYAPDSPEYRGAESLLRHYLIARQLHDDAHDWEEDLLRGCVNSIGALLIGEYREHFSKDTQEFPITETVRPLRDFFWKETIGHVAHLIGQHVQEARRARDSCTLLDGTGFLENALVKLEKGATEALAERDGVLEILARF
jgi:hypothetical protein